jgi:ribosomal-protein-alanine N-acetyltransferase
VEIRRPTPREIDQLVELDRRGFADDAYNAMTLRQFYDAAGELLVVAAEASAIVGYALALRASAPDEAWLMSVVVDENSRLKGIGRSLVEHTIRACLQIGISRILCTVDPKNHAALPLFAGLGFVEIDQKDDYFGPGKDRLVLQVAP